MTHSAPIPALLVVLLASACGDGRKPAEAKKPVGPASNAKAAAAPASERDPPSPGDASTPPRPAPFPFRFTDISATAGIVLENVSGDPVKKLAIPENIGQGAAVLDFDGDGRLDLFIANGDVFPSQAPRAEPRCALYRNQGEGRFADVTAQSGLVFKGWCHGAWAVDFDADGRTDLYITCYLRPNVFFRNQGDGTFRDVTAEWGGADPGPSTCAAFFDADQDGDLDLYVGNYVDYDPQNPPNRGQPCEWKGLRVSCGPLGTTPVADRFWENRDGRLVEATEAFGFKTDPSYALGCVAADFDGDGDTDLYVANDSRANFFFEQYEKGRFREVGLQLGVDMNEDGRAQSGMGVDAADVDNDGRPDLFVTNFSHDTNTLYHNQTTPDGRLFFADSTFAMKLGEASYSHLSWGTRILDLDHDGWQEIVVVSGHVYPQVDGANLGTSYAQRKQIFRNLGLKGPRSLVTFEDLPAPPGDAFARKTSSRGLAALDFDDDGDHDLVVVNLDARPELLRNDTPSKHHWIGFKLQGPAKNRDSVGSILEVTDAQDNRRWRFATYGAGFLSTSDPRLVFGLGQAGGKIRQVKARWPGGQTAVHEGLATDRYWILDAGAGTVTEVK